MTEFNVYFTTVAGAPGVTVEADDYEEAIDKAYASADLPSPGGLCHQCALQFDLSGEWEPESVSDADGKTVWERRRGKRF